MDQFRSEKRAVQNQVVAEADIPDHTNSVHHISDHIDPVLVVHLDCMIHTEGGTASDKAGVYLVVVEVETY